MNENIEYYRPDRTSILRSKNKVKLKTKLTRLTKVSEALSIGGPVMEYVAF